MSKPKTQTKTDKLLKLIRLMRNASNFSCRDPIEYDLGKYCACEKCCSCVARFAIEKAVKQKLIPK